MIINDYNDPTSALRAMTDDLMRTVSSSEETFNMAVSGGGTAQQMFNLWAEEYAKTAEWNKLRFYWVDERCVSPFDGESNYGQALRRLFNPLQIPPSHIFRIKGEAEPEAEAQTYSALIKKNLPQQNGMPHFDAIILGVGPDAHTASIFPDNMTLLTDSRLYATAKHPASEQQRITMTGPLILNNVPLYIPILGADKREIIEMLRHDNREKDATPSAYIVHKARQATVYSAVI